MAEKAAAEAAATAERTEREARLALKRTVKELIPKNARAPKRPKGRTAVGGFTRKEVMTLRAKAAKFLSGEGGLQAMEAEVQHTAVVIMLLDGVLGTEPWRAANGPHGGIIAANARLRYLENAARILDDIRRSRGGESGGPKLLDGVIDAEVVK